MLSGLTKLCGRTNAFTFLFYPQDEYDSNYLFTFLEGLNIPSCVSPLHDQDIDRVDPYTGETFFKDLHFHVALDFGSGKTISPSQLFDYLYPIRDHIGIVPLDRLTEDSSQLDIEKYCRAFKMNNQIHNMRSTLRYFKHLDHPNKHQYFTEDYHIFCGFDLVNKIYSQEDNLSISRELLKYIKVNEIYMFCDLVDYAMSNNSEWYSLLSRSQYSTFVLNYMRSLSFKQNKEINYD